MTVTTAARILHSDDSMSGMGGSFSGTVGGHVFPASFFVGVSLFYLVLTTQRLFKSESIEDFCASHIPERNPRVVRRVGIAAVIGTILGILIEGVGGQLFLGEASHPFFENLQHITLYVLFCVAGLAGIFESVEWLPVDSFRATAAAAFMAEAIIWNEHAQMKMNLVDQRIHVLVALTCLGSSVMMIVSLYRPDQIVPFLGGFLFMLWQGLWLFAAAFNINHVPHFDLEEMASYFILEGVVLGCTVLMGTMCWYRKRASQGQINHDKYSRVHGSLADDDEEEQFPIPKGTHGEEDEALRVI